jgi:hypothetical protein
VQAEAQAVHALAHLARAYGVADAVLPKLRAYAEAAGQASRVAVALFVLRDEPGKTMRATPERL